MRRRILRQLLGPLTLAISVSVSCLPLNAGIAVYTDRAIWVGASTNLFTLDFAGLGGAPDHEYTSGLTVGGVTFTGSLDYLVVRTASPNFLYGPPDSNLGLCDARWQPGFCQPGSHITAVLPPGVTSVGWDFSGFYSSNVTVVFPDSTSFSESEPGFVGFISTSPISSLEIHSLGGPVVTNFSLNTPEPSTLSQLLAAMTMAFGTIRFWRRLSAKRGHV